MPDGKAQNEHAFTSFDEILEAKPMERIKAPTGDSLYDEMVGILIGFAAILHQRDHLIDVITVRQAVNEMREMIVKQGGILPKKH